jgi:hypothetical protein
METREAPETSRRTSGSSPMRVATCGSLLPS